MPGFIITQQNLSFQFLNEKSSKLSAVVTVCSFFKLTSVYFHKRNTVVKPQGMHPSVDRK